MSRQQYGQPDAAGAPDVSLAIRWRNGDTGNRLDCETAVLLRTCLKPIFEQATSWPDLIAALNSKEFSLAIRGGRLVLTDLASGSRICTTRFLGVPLADLARRLGRPSICARRGGHGCGEFSH